VYLKSQKKIKIHTIETYFIGKIGRRLLEYYVTRRFLSD